MFRRFQKIWSRDLVRPLIHRAFTRIVWGLFLALFLAFMISRWGGRDLRSSLFLAWGLLCIAGAWLSYLQLDGARIPSLDRFRALFDRKRPSQGKGDMIDFVDEEMEKYEELDPKERYLVLLLADSIVALLSLFLSILL